MRQSTTSTSQQSYTSLLALRHAPTLSLFSSLDVDTIVRTTTSFASVRALLDHHFCSHNLLLSLSSDHSPPLSLHAMRALHDALNAPSIPDAFENFSTALERVTAVATHTHFRDPVLALHAVWAAQPTFSFSTEQQHQQEQHQQEQQQQQQKHEQVPKIVLVFVRKGSRHDDAALPHALDVINANSDIDTVYVIRLSNISEQSKKLTETDTEKETETDIESELDTDIHSDIDADSIATVISKLTKHVRTLSAQRIEFAATAAERARRATRSSFPRSWFSSVSAPSPPPLLLHSVSLPSLSSSSPSSLSSFTAALYAPPFDPTSVEAHTRRHADFLFVSGAYSDAAEVYTLLAQYCKAVSLTGLAVIHEAAAAEMIGVCRAMVHAPGIAYLPSLLRALDSYVKAKRPELALRCALRAVELSREEEEKKEENEEETVVGELSLGMLQRVRDLIAPSSGAGALRTGSEFVDCALATIAMKSAMVMYEKTNGSNKSNPSNGKRRGKGRGNGTGTRKRNRTCAMYAFIAMHRFATLGHVKIAGLLADLIEQVDSPLVACRSNVEQYVLLARANAMVTTTTTTTNNNASNNGISAVDHYARAMASMTAESDIEFQSGVVRAFLRCVAKQNVATQIYDNTRHWNIGAMFPVVDARDSRVVTADTCEIDDNAEWRTLEEDVMEDWEWMFEKSSVRQPRLQTLLTRLRNNNNTNNTNNNKSSGGSLEMKIRRMRDVALSRRRAIRSRSLLERRAVAGEKIILVFTMRNTLQFPVFVDYVCAVVSIDGTLHFRRQTLSSSSKGYDDNVVDIVPTNGVVLPPCAITTVHTCVVVKRACTLEFVGATWEFVIGIGGKDVNSGSSISGRNDEPATGDALHGIAMPAYAVLHKKGRRLNDTRAHRASEPPVYAHDVSLSVDVVSSAPRLTASLSYLNPGKEEEEVKPILRAGELKRALLTLRNTGALDISDIVIRVSAPYNLYVDVSGLSTSHALAADDTSFTTERLSDDAMVSTKASVRIPAGGVHVIPVWLHASLPSTQHHAHHGRRSATINTSVPWEAKLVIAYGEERVRVARAAIEAGVRCSVIAAPRFLRSAHHRAVLLGVEVEHAGRAVADTLRFDIVKLSIAARAVAHWRLKDLPSVNMPQGAPATEFTPSVSKLQINETATLFSFIQKKEVEDEDEEADNAENEWTLSSVNIGEENGKENGFEEKLIVEVDWDVERAARHFLLCARHSWHALTVVGRDVSKDWVFGCVRWTTTDGAIGQVHLPPMDPTRYLNNASAHTPLSPMSALDKTENTTFTTVKSPTTRTITTTTTYTLPNSAIDHVKISVCHPAEILHDFAQDSLVSMHRHARQIFPAVVDVNVTISNCTRTLLDVTVSAPPIGGIADGDRGRYWAGDVGFTLRSLPPRSSRMLRLVAVLVAPGRFNLSRFAVVVQTAGFKVQRVRHSVKMTPSFIEVENCNHIEDNAKTKP